MKNLIKTLVCAVLVLSVVSCRSNDDNFTEKIKPVEQIKTVELIPGKTNKLILSVSYDNTSGKTRHVYKLYSMIKRFKFVATKEDKISKIHYDISFDFITEKSQGSYKYEHIEYLTSRVEKLEYNDTEIINTFIYDTDGTELKKVYNTKIKVTIYTQSGKAYTKVIDKVDVQL